ncbi:MAG TPA: amidoligase family protein [Paracoccaceae bacterium]|nr:amidoligase family protein [Paracoccaceae bacterium]
MTDLTETRARILLEKPWPLPLPNGPQGKPRRVGVEIELAGLTEAQAAGLVQAAWGGEVRAQTDHDLTVTGGAHGDVGIELDIVLRDRAGNVIADKLLDWSRAVVPVEIVTAPLLPADLARVDRLIGDLVAAGAEGSQDGLFYGFGMHLNPEVAGTDATGILPVVRAYGLMEDWLRAIDPIDPSRRLLPFVDPWPHGLVDLLATEGDAWDIDDLLRAYARLTPTRNRGLDLLPLLEHLRPAALSALMDPDMLKGGRPTYHYRLPEARLGAPGWSAVYEWNRWVLIERVAADPDLLAHLAELWRDHRDSLTGTRGDWALRVQATLGPAAIWS